MPDLIPFVTRQIGTESKQTVNARDLYDYLALVGDYNRWIKSALKRAHFIENVDFTIYYQSVENPQRGRPAVEHHLTFDASKHISMMSSSQKGREARDWFIAKEKELAALRTHPSALDRFPELRAIVELAESTAAARLVAEEAKAHAAEAKIEAAKASANAERALDTQQFLTVAEYVYINQLKHQLPESAYKACSDHLRLYCMDHRIPFRKIPVGGRRWDDEYGFHVSVWAEVFPGWLLRRNAQSTLPDVSTHDWDPRDA